MWKLSSAPITWTVVGLGVMVGKVEKALNPVQGHFGLQQAVDDPGEVIEGKNEHVHQGQGREHLGRGAGGEVLQEPALRCSCTHLYGENFGADCTSPRWMAEVAALPDTLDTPPVPSNISRLSLGN